MTTSSYTELELTILETLKERLTVGTKEDTTSVSSFHSNLPSAASFTYEQVAHSVAVLSLEGLIETAGAAGRIVNITREGLLALRASGK